ncbi:MULTISPECIES: phosphodiester glycosidase family protein [unclassified Myroides]|uniref:phosphodiester glycosidase family protein n=1 Tax=unclassified Myroides TaxID=2642485 RepID=UPI003D2F64B9
MKSLNYILFSLLISFQVSCQTKTDDTFTTYEAIPKTEMGAQLVKNSNLIAQVFKDSTYTLTEGVQVNEFSYLAKKGYTMKTFVYTVDLNNPSVSVVASMPHNKPEFAMQPMTEQATALLNPNFEVVGGVNGDFYDMTSGVPRGIFVFNGMILRATASNRNEGYLAVDKQNKVSLEEMENFDQQAATLQQAVSGGVWLVKNGQTVVQSDKEIHPRTAVGITSKNQLLLMVVDGRNYTWSNGMNYEDLGDYMRSIGSERALNLDGGGSSTFFINPNFTVNKFQIRNLPSDNGGIERAVGNGIIITKTK